MDTIQEVLRAWGTSKAVNDPYALDYPHETPFAKQMRNSGQWAAKAPPLGDEHHARVDAAVSELKTRQGYRYDAICYHYIEGNKDHETAKALCCSTSKAREYRIAGENWLEAKLF